MDRKDLNEMFDLSAKIVNDMTFYAQDPSVADAVKLAQLALEASGEMYMRLRQDARTEPVQELDEWDDVTERDVFVGALP